jgi:hypothetical protein
MRKLGICATSLFGVVLPLLFLSAFLAPSALAACHAVSISGAGTKDGSSWTNAKAYSSLAGSGFVRGDVYYFADGNYGTGGFSITTAASGTKTITIKKAQSYNYGRTSDGCSNDISAGWNAATMGSSQAVWNAAAAGSMVANFGSGGYYIINGNGQYAANEVGCGGVQANPPANMEASPPNPSNCGFKWDDSTCTVTTTDGCSGGWYINGGAPGIQLLGLEIKGQGLNSNGNNNSEAYAWFASGGNLSGVVIRNSYSHNQSTTTFTVVGGGWEGGSFDHNYLWGNFDGSVNHGEAIQLQGNNGQMIPNNINDNIFRDQQTNGDVVGTDIYGARQTFNFYNNVDFCSAGGTSTSCRHNDGVIGCFGTSVCANVKIYNNTFSFPSMCGFNVSGGAATMTVENNLWYNCTTVGMVGGTNTVDYNTYLNSSQSAVGAHDVSISSGAANPFVSLATGNVNLVSDSSNYDNRLSLAAPFSIDLYGNSFTTNRGAAQYASSSIKPGAPSNLSGTVR